MIGDPCFENEMNESMSGVLTSAMFKEGAVGDAQHLSGSRGPLEIHKDDKKDMGVSLEGSLGHTHSQYHINRLMKICVLRGVWASYKSY